jgi:type I restriction-modification system DNA methylase subunit
VAPRRRNVATAALFSMDSVVRTRPVRRSRRSRRGTARHRAALRGEILFIDARRMGTMIDRVHRELTDEDTARIAGTYHAWRGDKDVS